MLEIKKNELKIKKLECQMDEVDIKILERLADIERLEQNKKEIQESIGEIQQLITKE